MQIIPIPSPITNPNLNPIPNPHAVSTPLNWWTVSVFLLLPSKDLFIACHGEPISELRSITCHTGSHLPHDTVWTPHLNRSQWGWLVLDSLILEELWLFGYILRWFICPQTTVSHPNTNHLIATWPRVEPTTSWSQIEHRTIRPQAYSLLQSLSIVALKGILTN